MLDRQTLWLLAEGKKIGGRAAKEFLLCGRVPWKETGQSPFLRMSSVGYVGTICIEMANIFFIAVLFECTRLRLSEKHSAYLFEERLLGTSCTDEIQGGRWRHEVHAITAGKRGHGC